jgi:hypothetical protein
MFYCYLCKKTYTDRHVSIPIAYTFMVPIFGIYVTGCQYHSSIFWYYKKQGFQQKS